MNRNAYLSVNLIDPEAPTGRTIPRLGFCPGSSAEAIRYYRDTLGSALTAAQDALRAAREPLSNASASLTTVRESLDRMLASNPDPSTPRSVDALTDAVGGLRATTDRETLEQRAGEVLDLNVVDGVLFPKGSTQLGALRQLAQALNLTADSCDLSKLGGAVDGEGEGFLLVVSSTSTTEQVVGSTCGEDIVEFVVTEQTLGTNVNIDTAAETAGVDSADVIVRLFWLDSIASDASTLQRLRALGLTPEELGAALTGQNAGRLTTYTIDTSVISALLQKLSDEQLCRLLARPDTASGINTEPTADEVAATIRSVLSQNTGSRNRAGTDEDAITSEAAGRSGDPVLLLLAVVDIFGSLGLTLEPTTTLGVASLGLGLDGSLIDEDDVPSDCKDIINIIRLSLGPLLELLQQAQVFMRELFQLSLLNHQVSLAAGFTSCLVSFNLGLDLNVEIAFELPFQMDLFLASFATLLASVTVAITALRGVICQPQSIISLLYGGVCGFKPFDFSGCPPDIASMVQRFLNILQIINGLVSKVGSALLFVKSDARAIHALTQDLKFASPCALAATAIGLALGLGDVDDLAPTATATVTS